VKVTVLTTALVPMEMWGLWSKYSCYTQLVRIYTWILRFVNNCKAAPADRILHTTLSSGELVASRKALLLRQQHDSYPEVFQWIKSKKTMPGHHALAGMVVQLHEHALVVSGRVRREATAEPRKLRPLSLKHSLTRLLVQTEHRKQLHSGTSILMSVLGQSYFIPGLRAFLKRLSKTCAICQRANAKTLSLQMGLLPAARTSPSPPFAVVGIDFAGPFQIKRGSQRKPTLIKAYTCLFVCMSTRAIHLEVCVSMDTDEFLAAFHRFCHRRGTPEVIYSDNGSNFIGAKSELKQIQKMLHDSSHSLSHVSAAKEIQWKNTPPRSPHFGGIWEAGVREMKRLLKKVVAPHPLRYEEFESVLISVEAALNSRPLVPMGATDPEEDLTLTPGHFLIGRALLAPPARTASFAKKSYLRRWQLVQRLQQELWSAWKGYYLSHLQSRTKWRKSQANSDISVGDIVFVKDETLARGRWPLARITDTYPGSDGVVRVVDLMCNGATYKRSVHCLVKLHLFDDIRSAAAATDSSADISSTATLKDISSV